MSSTSKVSLDEVRWMVWLFVGWTFWLAGGHAPQNPPLPKPTVRCAACGGEMRVVKVTGDPIAALSQLAIQASLGARLRPRLIPCFDRHFAVVDGVA